MQLESIRRVAGPDKDSAEVRPTDDFSSTWWTNYAQRLAASGLSPSALSVIDDDAGYIVDQGILGAGEPAEGRWPVTRLRRGLVMGAVQSGKTASLIGVTTKALDRGVNIVVILAGTRIALWRQTYERILSQLDGWEGASDQERRRHRVLVPSPRVFCTPGASTDLNTVYRETPNLVRRMLTDGRPLVAVVMKHADHLMHFGKFVQEVLQDTFSRTDQSIHMLVIDDEADDGSILDSQVEAGLAPDADGLKQIPRHIGRLWAGQRTHMETAHIRLYATYLAYTATPQANFLQADHNPLAPTDFVAALRVPLDEGAVGYPRATTFREPVGVSNYYCGGEIFYRRLSHGPGGVCVTRMFPTRSTVDPEESHRSALAAVREDLLSEALRAYFVSGAIRLYLSQKSLSAARQAEPNTEEAILRISPKPHSMLFHPSARVESHFAAAEEIAAWSEKFSAESAKRGSTSSPQKHLPILDVAGLVARLSAEEDLWKAWVEKFESTRERLSYWPGGGIFPKIDSACWETLRRILVEEVFPNTRLTVINSDPRADDRPRFSPERVSDSLYVAAPDIFSIFVSGNVMARGITIEGLVTTLFLRTANEPLADTQMQMQRWFGYRGVELCWCRVFMFRDQLDLFLAYHENDEAVRREIVGEMNRGTAGGVSPLVLQGSTFLATGKISNLRALPLCPGADPFVRLVETGRYAEHNVALLSKLLDQNDWRDVTVGGIVRGIAMERQLDLLEVADLLEGFRYSTHDPDPSAENHDRWRALARELGITGPEAPFFRPPQHLIAPTERLSPHDCPYSIAAYLRFWSALLSRRARGVYPTDNRRVPWSMIDLALYAREAPRFYVGVRYGSAGVSCDPKLRSRGILCVKREARGGFLVSTWGSRNPGTQPDSYLGDQLFDYHVHNERPPQQLPNEPIWRRRGAPGLVLFHVVRGESGIDAVTVGLALPLGGPDHIAALRPQ